MITGAQVKEAMMKANITEVEDHPCHFCGYMTRFIREGVFLWFDSGCFCSATIQPGVEYDPAHYETRSWESVANYINRQENEVKITLAKKFGLEL